LRLFLKLLLLGVLVAPTHGQDRHDWQSVSRLRAGDRVRVVLKTGPVEGEFQNWTAQELTVGTVTAKREDVRKIERYRHGGSRAKHAAFGAMIGFGGGFAIGAAGRPCYCTRTQAGVLGGSAFALIGAAIGGLLPTHSKELIYSAR
jgi:hypothetical protein